MKTKKIAVPRDAGEIAKRKLPIHFLDQLQRHTNGKPALRFRFGISIELASWAREAATRKGKRKGRPPSKKKG